MVMGPGKTVNLWGAGHASRPLASRPTGDAANMSTRTGTGERSDTSARHLVKCESSVSYVTDMAACARNRRIQAIFHQRAAIPETPSNIALARV
jgi:hypothetical protein